MVLKSSSFIDVSPFLKGKAKAYVSTRLEGFSKAPYDSFNLAFHVQDEYNNVIKNREQLKELLKVNDFAWMNQTHSSIVKEATKATTYEADGIVTFNANLALCVMTADCLPLLLVSDDKVACAAVHCGWKGLYQRIASNAIELIRSKTQSKIYAYAGPCINQPSYEVDAHLYNLFLEKDIRYQACFKPNRENHYLFNLYKALEIELSDFDIVPYLSNIDTFTDERFFSYRKNKTTGRFASIIFLNNK